MTVSDNTGYRDRTENWMGFLGQVSRYDLVLATIPLVFTTAIAAHLALSLSLHLAVGASALLSAGLVADVLYLHPPAPVGSPERAETGSQESAGATRSARRSG